MELLSVEPARKRFRRYCLAVQYRVDGGAELIVTWGRSGRAPRRRVETFDSLVQLQRRYKVLLARRRRHGYHQASRPSSEWAPELVADAPQPSTAAAASF